MGQPTPESVILYTSQLDKYDHLVQKLESCGYKVTTQSADDLPHDPSLLSLKSGNLYEGEINLAHFVVNGGTTKH